jgi:hypothetical protein
MIEQPRPRASIAHCAALTAWWLLRDCRPDSARPFLRPVAGVVPRGACAPRLPFGVFGFSAFAGLIFSLDSLRWRTRADGA